MWAYARQASSARGNERWFAAIAESTYWGDCSLEKLYMKDIDGLPRLRSVSRAYR
jgi:hypothetical protein